MVFFKDNKKHNTFLNSYPLLNVETENKHSGDKYICDNCKKCTYKKCAIHDICECMYSDASIFNTNDERRSPSLSARIRRNKAEERIKIIKGKRINASKKKQPISVKKYNLLYENILNTANRSVKNHGPPLPKRKNKIYNEIPNTAISRVRIHGPPPPNRNGITPPYINHLPFVRRKKNRKGSLITDSSTITKVGGKARKQ